MSNKLTKAKVKYKATVTIMSPHKIQKLYEKINKIVILTCKKKLSVISVTDMYFPM